MGQTLGGFEVLDEIGRGGMGVVYKARQLSLGRLVAVKVLPEYLAHDPEAAVRFEREAHNMARLHHPHIVDVIDVGEDSGVHYFAMQYVEGESLQALIGRGGPLQPLQAADLAAQVADALAHAHAQGVIHRDIKPANILVDRQGRVVVTDFGIAKTFDDPKLTGTGTAIGSPDYMSPELVKGNPIDERTDLYSLGVVLYEMVTGRVPFAATTPIAAAVQHMNTLPSPPRLLAAQCPDWLERVILKALSKEPTDRFSSAAEMAQALRASAPEVVERAPERPREAPETRPRAALANGRSRRKWRTAVLLVALAIVATAAVVVLQVLRPDWLGTGPGGGGPGLPPGGTPPGPVVRATFPVPDVISLTAEQAEARLKSAGAFSVDYKEPAYNRECPVGAICAQDPRGTELESGGTVHLTKSLGPDPRKEVPAVTGKPEDEARAVLRDRGFQVTVNERRYNDEYSSGQVCSQSPLPGCLLAPGDVVCIAISQGARPPAPLSDMERKILGTWRRESMGGPTFEGATFRFHDDHTYEWQQDGSSSPETGKWALTTAGGDIILSVGSGEHNNRYRVVLHDGDTGLRTEVVGSPTEWVEWRRT